MDLRNIRCTFVLVRLLCNDSIIITYVSCAHASCQSLVVFWLLVSCTVACAVTVSSFWLSFRVLHCLSIASEKHKNGY